MTKSFPSLLCNLSAHKLLLMCGKHVCPKGANISFVLVLLAVMIMMMRRIMVVKMVMMVMIMLMRMVLIMMVMIGAPELCSRIPPHFVRRSRSFDFGRSRSCCKDQGSLCPRKDL